MNDLLPVTRSDAVAVSPPEAAHVVPALVASLGDAASWRYIKSFTTNILNANMRRAYARACAAFLRWCEQRGLGLASLRPFDIAAYIELSQQTVNAPSVKLQLAVVHMLFDWLVVGQVMPANPASSVRGPEPIVKTGKTPVLKGAEWRQLMTSIPIETVQDLRDPAVTAVLTYSFARIGAALGAARRRSSAAGRRLGAAPARERRKQHAMPCHHALADTLQAYIESAGIACDLKGFMFRTRRSRRSDVLSKRPMRQTDAWRIIRRRAGLGGTSLQSAATAFRRPG